MIAAPLMSPLAVMAQDSDILGADAFENAPVEQIIENDNQELFDQSWFEEQGWPVDFDNPEWLAALALLIPFYLMMRSIPPRPKEEDFPFIRLLLDLKTDEQEADKMPWWQRAINMAAVASIAVAAAGPNWIENPDFEGDGPVLVAIDNGWASAANWGARIEEITDIIRHAHNDDRQIIILPTAPSANNIGIEMSVPMDAAGALEYIQRLEPQAWSVDHQLSLDTLETLEGDFGATFWLSNGLQDEATLEFASTLNSFGPLIVLDNGSENPVYLINSPQYESGSFTLTVQRSEIPDTDYPLYVSAYTEDNVFIARLPVDFEEDSLSTEITFEAGIRNANGHGLDDAFRFAIDGQNSAGAVALVDEQWRPRTVGLAIQSEYDVTSLLGEGYYINIALSGHANVEVGNIESLIDSGEVSVLMVPDSVILSEIIREKLENWVREGGTLVRFAGPNLARDPHNDDPLLPVDLRRGFRSLEDSVLSSGQGQIAEFSETSPFYNNNFDANIQITRQILAQPGPETDRRVWARLNDGTPLVSANNLGGGQVVFYHTTANTQGSDLPLSPLFIDMLVDIVQQSNSIEDTSDYILPAMPPINTLDAFGDLQAPLATVEPVSQDVIEAQYMGPLHPPGFYGNTVTRYAFNIGDTISGLNELGTLPDSIERMSYEQSSNGFDLKHYLFAGALGLLLASQLVLFGQQGHFDRKGSRRRRNNDQRHDEDASHDINDFEPGNYDF